MTQANDKAARSPMDRLFAWYWDRRAARADDPAAFHRLALRRRAVLDRIARRAEAKLTRNPPAPDHRADWVLRPDVFSTPGERTIWTDPESGFRPGRGLSVFHDSEGGRFAMSQRPAQAGSHRFELFFESYEFRGSYLSLALSVPEDLRRPKLGEILRLSLDVKASRTVKTFCRLNLKSAQNSDTLHADGAVGDGRTSFDFDMSFAAFEPGPRDQIWLDLILDRPRMVEIAIRDLSLTLSTREGA